MAKILLGVVLLAAGFENLLGQKYNDHGKNSAAVRYNGPVVYSNLPPPVLYFPTFPDKPEAREPKPGDHKIKLNNANSPLEYIPLPYHDLPVLIYHSNKNPPIHVIQKQINSNPDEKPQNIKYPMKAGKEPETPKYGPIFTKVKKPQIKIAFNKVHAAGHPHITVKLSPNAQVLSKEITEMDGKRVVSIGIVPALPPQDVPMDFEYGFSNLTEKNPNSEKAISETKYNTQMPINSIPYMEYDERNFQLQSNNSYFNTNGQEKMNYGLQPMRAPMYHKIQQYMTTEQPGIESYDNMDEKKQSEKMPPNYPMMISVAGKHKEQGHEGMSQSYHTFPKYMQKDQKQVQMDENKMSNYEGSQDEKPVPFHENQNQKPKLISSDMALPTGNQPLEFLDNQRYKHIIIHIPHSVINNHSPQDQQEEKAGQYTNEDQVANVRRNVGYDMKKSMAGFQNQNYNEPHKEMPFSGHEARNSDLKVAPSSHFTFRPNTFAYQNHEHHSEENFANPDYDYADFASSDHAATESKTIPTNFALPSDFKTMFSHHTIMSPQYWNPQDLGYRRPRESSLSGETILASSSKIEPKIINLLNGFSDFQRFTRHKSHISKRDTSLRTTMFELKENLDFMPPFGNFYKMNANGLQDFSNQGQPRSSLSYQQIFLPEKVHHSNQERRSNSRHNRNNFVNGNVRKRPTSIQDYINDDSYDGQESQKMLSGSVPRFPQHKPPIIIYKGIKPPIHIYGDKSMIEKPRK